LSNFLNLVDDLAESDLDFSLSSALVSVFIPRAEAVLSITAAAVDPGSAIEVTELGAGSTAFPVNADVARSPIHPKNEVSSFNLCHDLKSLMFCPINN
jgi:hypothetical protein